MIIFEPDTPTIFPVNTMDNMFVESGKLFFLDIDLKIQTNIVYCRRKFMKNLVNIPVQILQMCNGECNIYVAKKTENVPSQLLPICQQPHGSSGTWANDVQLHIVPTNESKSAEKVQQKAQQNCVEVSHDTHMYYALLLHSTSSY